MRVFRRHLFLLIILISGAVLRCTNLNWDQGGRLHPDEALIVNGALSIKFFSQLFPGFHDYNGLSVYLLKIASHTAALLSGSSYWSQTQEGVTIVGRFLSEVLSTLSIPLLFLLGKRMWHKNIGIVAAALFAFTPLSIQLAHFYTTESIIIFLFLILLHAALWYIKKPDTHLLVRMAITTGLLLATKNTSYLFLPIPISILFIGNHTLTRSIRPLIMFLVVCATAFFVGSPYSFIDLPGYITRSWYLKNVVSGTLPMDWTIQFQETNGLSWIPYLLYASGLLTLVGVIGTASYVLHHKIKRDPSLLFAVWSLGFIVFLAFTYLKFTRYAAPLIPFFSLFAAKLLTDMRQSFMGRLMSYTVIGLQIIYGFMFFAVYTTLHTSLQASSWISTHVPPGSVILIEEWNSIIRFTRPELVSKNYRIISFNFYSPDDAAKIQQLEAFLHQTDYILLESPKVKNTIMRLSSRYPNSRIFYEHLENGSLGFTKVASFTSYPRLGPFIINDDLAEETFTVFDHPAVSLYKKIR